MSDIQNNNSIESDDLKNAFARMSGSAATLQKQ